MSPRWFALAALTLPAFGCQRVGSQTQSPPIDPQNLPVVLEQPRLLTIGLIRPPLLQTKILDPRVATVRQSDQFTQNQALLDVLWVVANSGAMKNERDLLAQALPSFTAVLTAAKTNWQIAVTSSDRSSYRLADGTLHVGDGGKLHGSVPLISLADPMALSDFAAALRWDIQRNSAPSQTSIFAAMQLALDAANPNGPSASGFLRPGAALAVIAAANSDDQSVGPVGYFTRYLKGLKGRGNEELVTFSALGGPDGGCTPQGQEQVFGAHVDPTARLQQLTRETGGVFDSICDEAGFNGSLSQIAANLKTLRRYFPLSAPPTAGTLSVTVDGQPVAEDPLAGWQYLANINSVAFLGQYLPDPGAVVKLNYAVGGA